jgi:hypothetical protein
LFAWFNQARQLQPRNSEQLFACSSSTTAAAELLLHPEQLFHVPYSSTMPEQFQQTRQKKNKKVY